MTEFIFKIENAERIRGDFSYLEQILLRFKAVRSPNFVDICSERGAQPLRENAMGNVENNFTSVLLFEHFGKLDESATTITDIVADEYIFTLQVIGIDDGLFDCTSREVAKLISSNKFAMTEETCKLRSLLVRPSIWADEDSAFHNPLDEILPLVDDVELLDDFDVVDNCGSNVTVWVSNPDFGKTEVVDEFT